MANSKVVFEVVATSKGLKVVAKDINATSKATDKLGKSQDKANKSQNRFDKGNKALYQTNLSSAKSFSKMNQTIGGDGGSGALVGSYAILAANVFAVSAAFNALRGAMQVEKLSEGLVQFSNQSGQSLGLVSRRLQEATGFAVSMEQAMKTAALSTSAGFGVAEMEGLTRVAKGASQALGRDMGDALDRLTRGAIKLEPEILDELGIMVRLDDATETYAATLGKSANSLTRFEKQQAFMNAIITEGEMKFGAIADAIDPNVYDQLAATFADLSKDIINLLNVPLGGLIKFFLQAKSVFLGVVLVFAGSIAKKMVPAFGDLSRAAITSAAAAKEAIAQSIAQGSESANAARKMTKPLKAAPAAYNKIAKSIADGTATTQEMTTAQQQLSREINKLGGKNKETFAKASKQNQKIIKQLRARRQAIIDIKSATGGTGAQKAFDMAQANLRMSQDELAIMTESERQTFSLKGAKDKYHKILTMTTSATKKYYTSLMKANGITKKSNILVRIYRGGLSGLASGFKFAGISAKVFGKALIGAIPFIGQAVMMIGLLFEGLKFAAKMFGFFSEESKAAKQAMKDLDEVISDIPNKVKEMADQQERAIHSTTILTNRYKIIGGLLKTINDETKAAIDAQQKAGGGAADDLFKGTTEAHLNKRKVGRIAEKDARMTGAQGIEDIGGEAASALKKSLDGMSAKEFVIAKTASMGLGNALQFVFEKSLEAEKGLGLIGRAAEGLGTTFLEAEKEAGKFLVAIQPTTKLDGLATNFDAIVNGLVSLRKEAAGTDADLNAMIGESAQKMGSSTAMLFGKDVFQSFSKLGKINSEIVAQQQKRAGATFLEKRAIDANIKGLQKKYKEEQKNFGKFINDQGEKRRGLILDAKAEILLFKEKEKFDKAVISRAKVITKDAVTNVAARKVQTALDNLKIANLKREQGLVEAALNVEKANKDLNDKEREVQNAYEAKARQIAEIEARSFDVEQERLEMKIDGLKILQKEIDLQNQLFTLNRDIATLELDASVRTQRGGNAEASKSETSGLEMKTAEAAYALAVEVHDMKMLQIQAEHDLLAAKVAVETLKNDAEIKKETTDSGITERGQALTDLNSALNNSVSVSARSLDLQKKVITATLEKAGLVLDSSMSKVLAGMGNAFTQSGGAEGMVNAMSIVFGNAHLRALETKKADIDALIAEEKNKTGGGDSGVLDRLNTQKDTNDSAITKAKADEKAIPKIDKAASMMSGMGTMIEEMFGEEGAIVSSFAFMGSTFLDNIGAMTEGFKTFTEKGEEGAETTKAQYSSMADGLKGLGALMGAVSALSAASGKAKVATIDKEIAAEKKRDGKSAESVAKIKALEQKKEAQEKKNFDRQKKMQMATVVINTAAAVAMVMAQTGVLSPFVIPSIIAMGVAQLAMISKTQYQGSGGGIESAGKVQEVNVGKRSNKVDVSQGGNSGELSFLRGDKGIGSNANSFIPGGAGGYKSYAAGGEVLVGERGPELVSPIAPYEVTPNDKMGGGTTNANFTINAVDAAGVEQVLMGQRGSIINMIREAAHEHGEEFIEGVNTASYLEK